MPGTSIGSSSRDHYNLVKACLIRESVGPSPKILDLGCGSGADLLKYQVHAPDAVVLMDIEDRSLRKALAFYDSKGLRYDAASYRIDLGAEEFAGRRLTVDRGKQRVPRSLAVRDLDLVSTFSVLGSLDADRVLGSITDQVHRSLRPGGRWAGCMIDPRKLFQRLGDKDVYRDSYCTITVSPDRSFFDMTPRHGTWASRHDARLDPGALADRAAAAGFTVVTQASWVEYMGSPDRARVLAKLQWDMHMDLRLRPSDVYALDLLHVFVFEKKSKREEEEKKKKGEN
jgi:SAM-dependent methyltransferase